MSRRWLKLDNAALIFPAVRRKGWSNLFRLSATLKEDIDPQLLQQAVEDIRPRFPSFFVRLHRGMFWYYLGEIRHPLTVQPDFAYPVTPMGLREIRTCCVRVLYYQNRLACEFFHVVTDGSGGMVFLKALTARYLTLRYGVEIPPSQGVLDLSEPPRPEELEDSFPKHSAPHTVSRSEPNAYRMKGTPCPAGVRLLTTGVVDTHTLRRAAKSYGVTVTVFLAAVMAQSVLEVQSLRRDRKKPVKITVPVDLRRIFGSTTLRNFALALNPGVDPRLGSYTLQELCDAISHQLAAEATPQRMAGRIATNVVPQQLPILRIAPLFLKNIVLRIVYDNYGENKGSINVSNLGSVALPEEMAPYVERLEFIVGVQYTYPNNCSVATLGDTTCINIIRNIRQSDLEQKFFSKLVELGIPVSIESNERGVFSCTV